jgi:hypothetical protein
LFVTTLGDCFVKGVVVVDDDDVVVVVVVVDVVILVAAVRSGVRDEELREGVCCRVALAPRRALPAAAAALDSAAREPLVVEGGNSASLGTRWFQALYKGSSLPSPKSLP